LNTPFKLPHLPSVNRLSLPLAGGLAAVTAHTWPALRIIINKLDAIAFKSAISLIQR